MTAIRHCRCCKTGKYDFLVTDWNMPGMTGIDLLKAVRADAGLQVVAGTDGDGRSQARSDRCCRSGRRQRLCGQALHGRGSEGEDREDIRANPVLRGSWNRPMSKKKKSEHSETLDPGFTDELRVKTDLLKEQVDAGNFSAALEQIQHLNQMRDQSLYREVGRLTRSCTRPYTISISTRRTPNSRRNCRRWPMPPTVWLCGQNDQRRRQQDPGSGGRGHAHGVESCVTRRRTLSAEWQRFRRREYDAR